MVRRDSLCPGIHHQNTRHTAGSKDRLVMVVLSVIVLVAVLVLGNGSRNLYAGANEPMVQTITVHDGDTLWSLAKKYGDPNQYMLERVNALEEMNNMGNNAALHEGQTLIVPVSRQAEAL